MNLRRPETALGVKRYTLPMLDAMAGELSICPLVFQRRVLRIRNQLDRYNQHVEYVQSQFEKTFDTGVTGDNRLAVLSNLDRGYGELAEMAQRMADGIGELRPGPTGGPR